MREMSAASEQGIQVRRLDIWMTGRSNRIETLVIGEEKQNIGAIRHMASRVFSRRKPIPSRVLNEKKSANSANARLCGIV
jgi:hypothetical protein